MHCIVGLRNAGEEYAKTRHNLGECVVRAFAKKYALCLKRNKMIQGNVASGQLLNVPFSLFLAQGYMNNSGVAVKKAVDFFQLPLSSLLVVFDDITLPFGMVRMQPHGGCKGHNGMKSVAQYLQSTAFPRLRLGISDRSTGTLEDYVLSPFTLEEQRYLDTFVNDAIVSIENWLLSEKTEEKQQSNP